MRILTVCLSLSAQDTVAATEVFLKFSALNARVYKSACWSGDYLKAVKDLMRLLPGWLVAHSAEAPDIRKCRRILAQSRPASAQGTWAARGCDWLVALSRGAIPGDRRKPRRRAEDGAAADNECQSGCPGRRGRRGARHAHLSG